MREGDEELEKSCEPMLRDGGEGLSHIGGRWYEGLEYKQHVSILSMSITRHLLVVEIMAYTLRDLGLNIKTMLMWHQALVTVYLGQFRLRVS